MTYNALVIEDDSQAVEQIEDVLAALCHEHDLASSLLQARRLMKANEYSYVLLDIEFPTRSSGGVPRIQNAENFLDELAVARDGNAPPVIILSERTAGGLDQTEDLMRLAMLLGRKGAADLIKKPFPTAGRTLDRVIKKALGLYVPTRSPAKRRREDKKPAKLAPGAKRGSEDSTEESRHSSRRDDSNTSDGAALTKAQRDVLEALAESPHETMHLAELVEASGYRKHATREALKRLRSLGLAHRPQGERRGDALTSNGRALLDELTHKG